MISVFTATAAFTHVHKAVAPELKVWAHLGLCEGQCGSARGVCT